MSEKVLRTTIYSDTSFGGSRLVIGCYLDGHGFSAGDKVVVIPEADYDTLLNGATVLERVKRFMIENRVTCEEAISQCDHVIVNAYDFMADLFNLVKSDLPEEVD